MECAVSPFLIVAPNRLATSRSPCTGNDLNGPRERRAQMEELQHEINDNALSMSLVLALGLLAWAAGFAAPGYSATNPASGRATSASEPRVIEVDAMDFAFSMPDSIEGGWVTFRMRNTGQEVHNLSLRKLNESVTFDQVLPLVAQGAPGDLRRIVTSTSGVRARQPRPLG